MVRTGTPLRRQFMVILDVSIVNVALPTHAGYGAFMEQSGRNPWQPVANGAGPEDRSNRRKPLR
jgi:hypothetical protein